MKRLEYKVFDENISTSTRLDLFLLSHFQLQAPELSRSRFQTLIEAGFLSHDGTTIKSGSRKITPGSYTLTIPDSEPSHITGKDIPITIIFEDDDLIVINKPAGLSVHPGAGNTTHTLVNALLHSHAGKLSGIGGIERPGIVHRLDKETSGLIVVAKHDSAHHRLSSQFSNRTLSRTYIALVFGKILNKCGAINTLIGRHPKDRQRMAVIKSEKNGKIAITHYKVLDTLSAGTTANTFVSLVECTLETGRTHQIRVHMQHLGHPLVGDPVYGKNNLSSTWDPVIRTFPRQALHAKSLKFIHPTTGENMAFEVPLPEDMQEMLNHLKAMGV